MILDVLVAFINLFVPVYSGVLLVRIILSYILRPDSRVLEALGGLTEPLLAPLRKVIPPAGGIDFSPLVLLLLLQALQTVADSFLHT